MNATFTSLQWVNALCSAFDAILVPDVYTHTHQILTANFTKALSNKLGVTIQGANIIWMGARLHDIGKIGIMLELQQIKDKKIDHDDSQFAIIKRHSSIGERFFRSMYEELNQNELMLQLSIIAKHHHENWDGTGYPDGLREYRIPYYARIIRVVDALSAMIGPDRPYRASLPFTDALRELERFAGTQFDPHIVAAVLELFDQHEDFIKVGA